ncbi:RNA-binding protein 2-like [Olea europaea var. sylvestris]|uniref:RNA-binding protein 2-like n=1 Tax=Olea europaea var. sylvestris TaxID=158386 RepID=UPI000C1CFBB7|nr:RNA-binding protein 2-like [Olea europaea var. sylvestris]XP_022860021.1 RNA-binding protein 2-like [Olea europaea var. sylvestris]XP_022860022.1 RNA-binding protein 2-like [Olea europaea var. sylvestris]
MEDDYWNNRQVPLQQSAGALKRPRIEYDLPPSRVPVGHEMHYNLLAQNDDYSGSPVVKDTESIGSAYDHYLQNLQLPSEESTHYGGIGLGRSGGGGGPALPVHDRIVTGRPGGGGPKPTPNGSGLGFGGPLPVDTIVRPRETLPLPPDASSTLYIEGLPPNSTRREVAHIFRPFVGCREVRLVRKESKHRGGDPLVLCFVDFIDPACAATALSALQGYKMDEHDPDSTHLRLQFSKHPGPRSAPAPRGRR